MTTPSGQSFVVFSKDGFVLVGRNSLGEGVCEVLYFPSDVSRNSTKCGNVEVEGPAPFAVILSRTINTWGAESGANEKSVMISVSFARNEKQLLATDLVRLALERSESASAAVTNISKLNDEHGEDFVGSSSPMFSFLVCDGAEVWILDIAGKLWAAEKLVCGQNRRLPSGLGVTTKIDRSSENVQAKSQEVGVWTGDGDFNFRMAFQESSPPSDSQFPEGEKLTSLEDMFKLLREHCPEDGTNSSQVSVLSAEKPARSSHWFTATPKVKESVFKPFVFTENVRISPLTVFDASKDSEVTLLVKYHAARNWTKTGDLLKSLEATCVTEVMAALASGADPTELEDLMKDCVEAEVKFYR